MTELLSSKSVSITELMNRLEFYKYNPDGIQKVILNYLSEVTDGAVNIVDPTNPFVFLLESSAVNTAANINENFINLRKQYPSLAQTDEDLYHHLSGKDLINRFATPADVQFTFVVQVNELLNKMPYDAIEGCFKTTIARDSVFSIDEYLFTLEYPIDIRKFDSGVLQISYDANINSPLSTLTSNIIDYTVRQDISLVNWIFFKIPVKQFAISTTYFPLQKSILFSQNIDFTDQYYYSRIFYRNTANNNKWVEINTSHTDQVFDPLTPTAILKVYSTYLNIFIPPVYLLDGSISGEIRIDIYTTKGNLVVNLSNYKLNSFTLQLTAVDEERDINDYTNSLSDISHYVYSDQIVNGGTNGLDFAGLRDRVIANGLNDRSLPITNVQLSSYVSDKGFDLIRNVDTITNRIFLATAKLPKPTNDKLITPANIGIGSFVTNNNTLAELPSVKVNPTRITLLSKALYKNTNGVIKQLTTSELSNLNALSKTNIITEVNNNQYLYNPFYYVLDDSLSEFEVRAYNLDYPIATNLSFNYQNDTAQLAVNTGSYMLTKIPEGYKLSIITKSGNFFKQLNDSLINLQIGFTPIGETNMAYINGVQDGKTSDGERIYSFILATNYDIDSNNNICITNSKMFSNQVVTVWTSLATLINIFYTTTSVNTLYKKSNLDGMIGSFILPDNTIAITHESLEAELGTALKNLWTRSRIFSTSLQYELHKFDVPLLYNKDIYQIGPVTGSIFTFDENGELVYTVLHHQGDPVLDVNNQPVYKYKKDSVVLDNYGNPVTTILSDADKEIDMLFVDGKYLFSQDSIFDNYRNEIVALIDNWVNIDMTSIQALLLEQTKIFFYPKTSLNSIKVYLADKNEDYINAEQSFTINLYVRSTIFDNTSIRNTLVQNSIKILDANISNSTVNTSDITSLLKNVYQNSVVSFDIHGLGGSKDYRIVELANDHNRLCLKKKLSLQVDNSLVIAEDVIINFYNLDNR